MSRSSQEIADEIEAYRIKLISIMKNEGALLDFDLNFYNGLINDLKRELRFALIDESYKE